ncbi:hypothetical protein EYF80_007917 [Liparis tanakae]|uniref:Uncharacterized protein n=1 Tax=Liparis tanakae TaxID=230148 RepID=A0A4Z2IW93_9TELE|nr:hypothetical protein EYF80_007917 [Liparis tanakae]
MARQAKVLRILWRSASSMTDFLTLPRQRVEVKQKERKDLRQQRKSKKGTCIARVPVVGAGDHDDEDGRDAAQDDDDGQGQESALCVAHGLGRLLHAGHDVRGADLQNTAALAQIRLELLVDFQHIAVKKSAI